MSYVALARKYRPKRLDDLVGQENLVETLKNAIEQNRIHHAFIFTGTRGVGKTTTARILALSLNCIGEDGNGKETTTPCLKCKNCLDIMAFRQPDVIEIDAASNTGVDSAREIIESSKYPPMSARYKVYIIDEFHMLSKSAFNALLKTLEEPNEFVKFIFATTEFNKIPITISSRCQKFFLRNLTVPELAGNMENICSLEGVKYESDALIEIAKAARGSARDSLSILDQLISNSKTVSLAAVNEMLKVSDIPYAKNLLTCIFNGDMEGALKVNEDIVQSALGIEFIISEMIKIISEMMQEICTKNESGRQSDLLALMKESDNYSIQVLDRIWQVVVKSLDHAKLLPHKEVLDNLAMRIAFVSKLPSLDKMVSLLI